MSKSIISSKVFWFNVITIGIGIVGVVNKSFPIDPQILMYINGAGNVLLRLLTNKPIVFGNRTILGKRIQSGARKTPMPRYVYRLKKTCLDAQALGSNGGLTALCFQLKKLSPFYPLTTTITICYIGTNENRQINTGR